MADVTLVNAVHSHDPRVPLGALYLCSALEAEGYEVDFRDYQICDDDGLGTPEQFTEWLSGAASTLAFSTLSSSLPLVLASLSRRKLRQQVETVILGGPGVSSLGPEILESFPEVDIVASGEGERTLVECMGQLKDRGSLDHVTGITYRENGGIRKNPPRPRMADLDALPFPGYHLINMDEYTGRTSPHRIPLAVLSARGCPYHCTFCDIPGIWQGSIRYRSVAKVILELEQLKNEHRIPRFHITDDTFVLKKDRVAEFCRTLKEHHLDMPWSCFGRVDRMDEDMLDMLADANCETIFYGIESGSDRILERIQKGFSVSQALEVVESSLQFMKTHVSFIWGFPFESLEDLYDTIITLLVMHAMGAEPHLNFLAPLPSSEINRTFGKRKQSLKAWEIGWSGAMMENYEYSDDLHHLIRRFPDIFAPFYCLESPDFHKKVELLESWGLTGLPTAPPATQASPPIQGHRGEAFHDPRLPEISDGVLRRIGDKHYLLNIRDCNLYRAGPRTVELVQACKRGDALEDMIASLRAGTGCSDEAALFFVRRMLRKLAERGFLPESRTP